MQVSLTTESPPDRMASAVRNPSAAGHLVLGIGNVLLRDEGLGAAAVNHMQTLPEAVFSDVDFVDGGTLSFTLLPLIEDADSLIVVDAAELDCAPGTVRVFCDTSMDDYLSRSRTGSVHEVGLRDLLDMARLRDALPGRRALVAVQPARIDWGSELSPAVAAALPVVTDEVHRLLVSWS